MVFLLTLMLILLSYTNNRIRYNIYSKDIKETDAKSVTTLLADYIKSLRDDSTVTAVNSNGRYVGSNPNNYVRFNGELWRIIGVFEEEYCMSAVCDATVPKDLVKIVRNESLGSMSFDYKKNGVGSSVNDTGSNYWEDSQLMLLLNPISLIPSTYSSEGYSVKDRNGVTIYRNTGAYFLDELQPLKPALADVTNGFNSNATLTVCISDSYQCIKVLNSDAQNKIAQIRWKIGAFVNNTDFDHYQYDWAGKVGLPSNSDFLLASNVSSCDTFANWNSSTSHGTSCYSNDWLIRMDAQWSMSYYNGPDASGQVRKYAMISARSSSASKGLLYTSPNSADTGSLVYNVRPALYLKSDVKIIKGAGTESDPYVIY